MSDQTDTTDEDDKGPMVFTYQSDLLTILALVDRLKSDTTELTEREAEAYDALDADCST